MNDCSNGLKFRFYSEAIPPSRTLVADGVEPCRVNLSHWPNNQTPEHLKADTSTEIALNLAADPYGDRLMENIEFVSNNHFDTDGLLSCWTVMNPHQALRHRKFLVQAAQAGDFGWFPSPAAVKFDLVVSAFESPLRSPLRAEFPLLLETQRSQLIYDRLLEELPDLLSNFESRYRELYEEEFAVLVEAMQRLRNGGANIMEFGDAGLSVIEADRNYPLNVRFNSCQHDRLLTLTRCRGGWTAEFHYHIITWFETQTLRKLPRWDLGPLADALNQAEGSHENAWRFDDLHQLYPRLALTDGQGVVCPSRLARESIVDQFLNFFRNARKMYS